MSTVGDGYARSEDASPLLDSQHRSHHRASWAVDYSAPTQQHSGHSVAGNGSSANGLTEFHAANAAHATPTPGIMIDPALQDGNVRYVPQDHRPVRSRPWTLCIPAWSVYEYPMLT